MTTQPHISTQVKLRISIALACAVFVVVGFVAWNSRVEPFDVSDTTPLQVTSVGDIIQSGHTIARLATDGTIKLPLISPTLDSETTPLNLTLQFSSDAHSTVIPRLISIQGNDTVQYSWPAGTTLLINSAGYSPESYTTLVLTPSSGYFHPGISWYIRSGVHRISIFLGIILALLILGLAWWMMHRALRRPPWFASQQLNIPPLGLSPIQLAILHHSTIEPIDFVSFLISLADRGYLQIIEHPEGVVFARTSLKEGLESYEVGWLTILFPDDTRPTYLHKLIETLNRELFSAAVSQLYVEIYNTFNSRRFFTENPRIAHVRFKTIGILAQAVGLLLVLISAFGWLSEYPVLFPFGIGVFVSGLYIYRRAAFVVLFTPDAAAYITECAAFTSYLSSPHQIGAEGSQGSLFYTYVPYALAAGVTEQWLARFNGAPWYIPKWYLNSSEDIIDPATFLNHVGLLANELAKLMIKVKDPNAD